MSYWCNVRKIGNVGSAPAKIIGSISRRDARAPRRNINLFIFVVKIKITVLQEYYMSTSPKQPPVVEAAPVVAVAP
ncbi:hypothetical protein TI04_07945, partial [Achromatium sp. WMS2]